MLIHAIAIAARSADEQRLSARPPAISSARKQEVIRLSMQRSASIVTWAGPDASRAAPAPRLRVVLVPYETGDMLAP